MTACPDTTVVVDGTTNGGGDEVGETATSATDNGADGDVVEDHRTYFIGESTKFDGGGLCDNSRLNTVTNTFRNELADAGWKGLRFVNENSWPEDFREGSFSPIALDGIYGDSARISVYAGHGNVGLLQWGRPSDNGLCRNIIDSNSRLGKLDGDVAGATMLMTSCTLRVDQLWPVFQNQASRQVFGYHNSPHIGYDEARKVFKRTQDGQPTADAWLEEMVLNISGKNLASGKGLIANVGEPADNYYFEFYNSGCTVVCGNCNGNSTSPTAITLGQSVPTVRLTRPMRSSGELVDLATSLITLFDVGPLNDEERDRLDAWASAIVASGDVTHALVLVEPRIDLSYDPKSDLMRITNRDALAHARPNPGQTVSNPPGLADELLSEAEVVRAQLQSVPGAPDLLGTQFEVTTREVGYGDMDGQSPPIAVEYMFTLPGRFEGLALPDRHLSIGVTRLGELSTLTMSTVDVEVVGEARFQREPRQAIDALVAGILDQHPNATGVEIVEPSVGYTLVEEQSAAEVPPSLLVGYVIEFGAGDEAAVSRRYPVRISLVEPAGPIESLTALDPNPQGGDYRVAN